MEEFESNIRTDSSIEREYEYKYEPGDLNTIETDNGLDVSFRARVISDLLKCPICDGFFRNATTIRECLHTFCKYCISDHIYKKGPNCPKCDRQIGIHPFEGLVSDKTMQNITDKVLPQFKEREIILYEKFIQKYGKSAETESNNYELRQYRENNGGGINKMRSTGGCDIKYSFADSTEHFYNQVLYPQLNSNIDFDYKRKSCISNLTVRIKLTPLHETNTKLNESSREEDSFENGLEKPYILVAPQITIDHIRKYVIHKLKKRREKLPIIYLKDGALLPKNHSVEFICRSRRISLDETLVLGYYVPK
ncbi:ring domain protein [Cryptosporidium ryanae]|uniref:ring domain protein n=1 Tax=Cryptosporidium ryanae TaxID=515981 RepID=UPI00351A74B6|nr:ring domain protein [Cryptosporidium ryanae]